MDTPSSNKTSNSAQQLPSNEERLAKRKLHLQALIAKRQLVPAIHNFPEEVAKHFGLNPTLPQED